MEIMDTPVLHRMPYMRDCYLRPAGCFILVYSVTDENSMNNLEDFASAECARYWKGKPVFLVANKVDLWRRRKINQLLLNLLFAH
jgi:GTPase SAR1 family protein